MSYSILLQVPNFFSPIKVRAGHEEFLDPLGPPVIGLILVPCQTPQIFPMMETWGRLCIFPRSCFSAAVYHRRQAGIFPDGSQIYGGHLGSGLELANMLPQRTALVSGLFYGLCSSSTVSGPDGRGHAHPSFLCSSSWLKKPSRKIFPVLLPKGFYIYHSYGSWLLDPIRFF